MEGIVGGRGIGRDKYQEALQMLFEGEMQITVAAKLGVQPSSVNEFANHPDTKQSLVRMALSFEQEIGRKGAHEVRGALERTIEIAEDPDVEPHVRLPANKTIMATFGFAPGRKVELAGHVASVKVDMSKLPRELLAAFMAGDGDDFEIPDELLDEVAEAQGGQ